MAGAEARIVGREVGEAEASAINAISASAMITALEKPIAMVNRGFTIVPQRDVAKAVAPSRTLC